jgi:hypothetical protein
MPYDQESLLLAKYFVKAYNDGAGKEVLNKANIDELANTIQGAIEDWFQAWSDAVNASKE